MLQNKNKNMNRLFTAILLLLALTACTKNGYTIKGEYPDARTAQKYTLPCSTRISHTSTRQQ